MERRGEKVTSRRQSRRRTRVQQAFRLNAGGLGSRVVRGASYQFLGIAMRTATTIGSIAILARLLTPADFGYVAMATVVTEFAVLFANFGLANVLIQRRMISRLQLDTVFWASLALGALLSAMVFAGSFLVGVLYEERIVGPLLRVLCVTFLFGSLTTVPWLVLSRLMHFRAQFMVDALSKFGGAAAAVALAYTGFGVWSLALGGVAGGLINVAAAYAAVPYLPRSRFDWAHLRGTWRTSGSYFGGGLLLYFNSNVDLLLIGRYLGPIPLGYYQNARSLTNEIRARIAIPLQHVLFPAFSSLQHDVERSRELVMRSGRMLAAVVVPIGFGVSATAVELVPVLYGEKWNAMVPVMSMLGLGGALRASTAIAAPIFNSQDRVALGLRYGVISAALSLIAVIASLDAGINAVAAALAATSLYLLVTLHAAFRLIGLGARDVVRVLGAPFAAASLMWMLIHFARPYTSAWIASDSGVLAAHVALGATAYTVVLLMFSRVYLLELRAVLQKAI